MQDFVKNKYIVFNEDNKVLLLNIGRRFIFPTIIERCFDTEDISLFLNKSILDICLNESESFCIDTHIENIPIYNRNNCQNKNKQCIQYVKQYFGIYHEFSEEDNQKIYELSTMNNANPYMVTFEEIRKLIACKKLDFDSIKAINILEEELQKYRKR